MKLDVGQGTLGKQLILHLLLKCIIPYKTCQMKANQNLPW